MNIYVVWAAPLLMAGIACLAASPLFAAADASDERSSSAPRFSNLDGLRGYLALSVALHHGVITYHYLTTGAWVAPPSGFYNQLGQASVGLFFIITGFLFWGKILRSGGRLDFPELLVGRAFRIGPVFLTLIITLMAFAIVSQGFAVVVPAKVLMLELLQNLSLGILPVSGFNGVDLPHQLAGVTWTLVYEWEFYLFLPAVACLAWRRDVTMPAIAGLLVAAIVIAALTRASGFIIMAQFLTGMFCATLSHRELKPKLQPWLLSALAAACLVIAYGHYPDTLRKPWATAFLGLAFYFVISGADLFGLLRLRASHRLGAISYDLYLCHGAVLAAVFAIPALRDAALTSRLTYWVVLASIVTVAVMLALALHVWIERPGMALGRRVIARLRTPQIARTAPEINGLRSGPVAAE
ncbi:MAG: acyltransferase [Proteobacteria bacterium]|nr:acyltransferase [Pseudomonadota bacterium]